MDRIEKNPFSDSGDYETWTFVKKVMKNEKYVMKM